MLDFFAGAVFIVARVFFGVCSSHCMRRKATPSQLRDRKRDMRAELEANGWTAFVDGYYYNLNVPNLRFDYMNLIPSKNPVPLYKKPEQDEDAV